MSDERKGRIQTVTGLIRPEELGYTQPHEHLLNDLRPPRPPDVPGSWRSYWDEEITLENYQWIRRNALNRSNLQLTSEADAIEAMNLYRTWGGDAIFDPTPIGLGRDPLGLFRISRASGVHIVMGGGFYVKAFHPPAFSDMSEDDVSALICRDILVGVGDTGIRCGIIGEIGLSWPHDPSEEMVLRAAVRAQQQTGVSLQIHPGRDPRSPFEAMELVLAAGGDPDRTIMCHIERTLFSTSEMARLADYGCYLEFDLFGRESSYHRHSNIDMPNDGTRVRYLRELRDEGYLNRLLIAQDTCKKAGLQKYGGEGYHYILENILPLFRRREFSDDDLDVMTRVNPARVATIV